MNMNSKSVITSGRIKRYHAKTVGGKRLAALARHLERNVKSSKFNMGTVSGANGTVNSCGSTGCAMGHAPDVPLLHDAGLNRTIYGSLVYDGFSHYAIIASSLFNITYSDADRLFTPSSIPRLYRKKAYNSPRTVAFLIRRFIKRNKL